MKTRRNEVPSIADPDKAEPESFGQAPEKFASTEDLAWTDDEVRQVCEAVRDHL
jgi:hypothetical protein